MERQWEQKPSHHPEGQVQRRSQPHLMYRTRRTDAELVLISNKKIFWGEAVRLTDLPAGSWSGSGHLNRGHEAVDASPHPNGSVKASHFDLDINWGGLPGDTKY